ncbi:MAG: DUF952 domain-containing protein [Alphaproteobacteria bacterium]|nr:DUF952 domain-containing protein [Alphaproteobacteria bacterium]MBU1525058.1 DUF952 domain-containing protein [Alphaproteobacteria bacterium]MBU2117850.1 DUF952 domain-containing protein [Alphaproteobacteria bacterium]MBU2351356.1 DUF952 domain-containing protein [Alphaproteobacteria bacterium]MBU2383575.1 DUF952 domain-containing protein [Alphaproteobacteria bacterium]
MTTAFKIVDAAEWAAARKAGAYAGSPVDLADGYIHLSTAGQLEETARRHYAGRTNLRLLEVDLDRLDAVKWEPSRGGALFPHQYGALPVAAVLTDRPMAVSDAGVITVGVPDA